MFQFDFTLALLKEAKRRGLHVCMETCGFAPLPLYAETLRYVDIYLFDFKESDPVRHLEYTGVRIDPILNSLGFLDTKNARIFLRCPVIPNFNACESHFKAIGKLASRLKSVMQVDIEPYHPLGISKSERIGKVSAPAGLEDFPAKSEVQRWVYAIQSDCSKPVVQS